ncbi:hypothetical protein LL946_07855 [Knoellia locipacati]|uniref:hypothetical protein n=1 Tax=Knoellia locipacati TaxID=882824 RepID=UPI00384F5E5B
MWPWLMIIAGTLIIIGALVARHRMMRDYRTQLAQGESSARAAEVASRVDAVNLAAERALAGRAAAERTTVRPATVEPAIVQPTPEPDRPTSRPAVHVGAEQTAQPTFEPSTEPVLSRRAVKAGLAPLPTAAPKPPPLFADRPIGHRLSSPPTIRVRAQDVPLQDWLRYYAEGNAWSGVIQSISDRITGDRELEPFFGSLERATLQRHVMSTLMMLTGEGVTVGAVRRLAEAHLHHVQAGGEPISEPVWDRLAATLGNAMREHGVPEFAVQGLEHTAAPLRSVIVARPQA